MLVRCHRGAAECRRSADPVAGCDVAAGHRSLGASPASVCSIPTVASGSRRRSGRSKAGCTSSRGFVRSPRSRARPRRPAVGRRPPVRPGRPHPRRATGRSGGRGGALAGRCRSDGGHWTGRRAVGDVVLPGMSEDRIGWFVPLHHVVADGIAGVAEILNVFINQSPTGRGHQDRRGLQRRGRQNVHCCATISSAGWPA